MPSQLNVDTLVAANGTDPVTLTKQEAAKHWINFNGTNTPAARDSFNCSSITDLTTGQYHILYTNNMSDANNAPIGVSNNHAATNNFNSNGALGLGTTNSSMTLGIATSGYSWGSYVSGTGYVDSALNQGATHGDLA